MTCKDAFNAMRERSQYTLEQCWRDKMRYLKAAYILADGDREKVKHAIEQADDTTLRVLRGSAVTSGVPAISDIAGIVTAIADTSGVPTPPPAPQAKSRCASECDLICQQPNGHGGCAKRSTPEQAVQGALTKAAQDVLAERQRQIDKEGWTPAHDDAHGGGEMASAAAVYALRASGHFESGVPTYWPWDFADYKPKDNRSNLIRAGALVLAEIERLDRMEVKNG